VRDVAESPPADWTLERRVEYLAWSRRVVDGCRDASAALARNFDEVVGLAEARLKKTEA
jgi:GTP diphosphokinase / guanosine-3',5'-bis(diphosphate) 3'-diphosphatase